MCFILPVSFTSAQDFYALLNGVFDQPSLSRLHLVDLQQTQLKISTSYTYQDYYRESMQSGGSQYLVGDENAVRLFAVDASRPLKYGGILNFTGHGEKFNNLEADLSVNIDYMHNSQDLSLELALAGERILVGAGIDQKNSTLIAPIQISKYPQSGDSQMTTYLLNWLEPSFGNELDVQGEFKLTTLQGYTSLPVGHDLTLNLNYRISDNKLAPDLSYVNNSNISELQGDRRMIFNTVHGSQQLQIGLGSPKWSLTPTLTLQNTTIDLEIENPLPEGVIDDFPELGWLDFSRSGGGFAMEGAFMDMNLSAGLGYSEWKANTELKTPVLGRYWLFPISHAVQLDISGGSFSQEFSLRRNLFNRVFQLDLNVGYQHSYFDLRVVGEAELEFNIRSVPIDYPYQFHLNVVSFSLPAKYEFNAFSLDYEFTQLIPWLRRVDDSEMNLLGERDQPGKKVRGGGQHLIILTYTLR